MDMQQLWDSVSETVRRTRSDYHLTLGGLIDLLDKAKPGTLVEFADGKGPGREDSYRGYYADLAFEDGQPAEAKKLAKRLKGAAGSTYQGYKGGDFVMGLDTPLWRASYGNTGEAIIGARMKPGKLILETKDI